MNKRWIRASGEGWGTILVLILFIFVSPARAQHAADADFKILRHEHVTLGTGDFPQSSRSGLYVQQQPTNLTFTALGLRFHLVLKPNDVLLKDMPLDQRGTSSGQLYRGHIAGIAGSWVRLSYAAERWTGMLWDGAEAYILDSSAEVAGALQSGRSKNTAHHTIYRLSDTVGTRETCALHSFAPPLNDYRGLIDELQQQMVLPAASAHLNLAIVADTQFVQGVGNPQAAALSRINVVDGIFSEQVGVKLHISELRLLQNNGVLSSNNPSAILDQFERFVIAPGFTNPGLAH